MSLALIASNEPAVARPFLKWAGGKTQLLTQINRHVPERFGRYFEPFLGAGAVFFWLAQRRGPMPKLATWATLNDSNVELVTTWQSISHTPGRVIAHLKKHAEAYKRSGARYYLRERAELHEVPSEVAARMIFLNKAGFNGLYRVNKSGGFNVPPGKFKSPPTICDEANLKACRDVLQHALVVCRDFESAVCGKGSTEARRGDFVYFDPPYVPASASADFTAYTKAGFKLEDHERLRDVALRLKKKGVHVLLSNSDTLAVRKLYAKGFTLHEVKALRAINSRADKRGAVGELLIT